MKKVINPCTCEVYGAFGKTRQANAYAEIEWDGKRLSIHGVVGPMSNGNCSGSAGQCTDDIRAGTPVEGWSREMLDKFCNIWDRWHLNDMHPYCPHMKELGWREQARETVTIYKYSLTHEAIEEKSKAEKAATDALKAGEPFFPTQEQTYYACLPYSVKSYGKELSGETVKFYQPERKTSYSRPTETKIRGWISFDEDPIGLISKPCPVCGYKYGTSWQIEEVPQDVIDWLFALPDAPVQPAWV